MSNVNEGIDYVGRGLALNGGLFIYEECRPNSVVVARPCQFGLASAPIAPHTVHTILEPNEGTASSLA